MNFFLLFFRVRHVYCFIRYRFIVAVIHGCIEANKIVCSATSLVIIQLDAVNDHIFDAAVSRHMNIAGLFDASHGAGVLPAEWPKPRHYEVYHGYAGGIGPENVREQVVKITDTITGSLPFWIDMEGRVRTNEQLDLTKVMSVLETCKDLITKEAR